MSPLTLTSTSTSDAASLSTPPPHCQTCGTTLTRADKQITKDVYWKNCKKCRDKVSASRRKSRAAPSTLSLDDTVSTTKGKEIIGPILSFNLAYGVKKKRPAKRKDVSHQTALRNADERKTTIRRTVFKDAKKRKAARKNVRHRSSASQNIHSLLENSKENKDGAASSTAPAANVRDCAVCSESVPIEDFPELASCNHVPDVCSDCFLQWLDQQMVSQDASSVKCPSSGCNSMVLHQDVQKYASPEVFARFDELSLRSFLSTDLDFLYCPAAGCSSGQIHSTGIEGPIFRCTACGYRMCTAHTPMIAFHENETCAQYDERKKIEDEEARVRREQEEASATLLQKEARECPGCGSQIQKTDGCDHMTCRRKGCGFQFCYVCRAPYVGEEGIWQRGNAAHVQGCRYHPSRLPSQITRMPETFTFRWP